MFGITVMECNIRRRVQSLPATALFVMLVIYGETSSQDTDILNRYVSYRNASRCITTFCYPETKKQLHKDPSAIFQDSQCCTACHCDTNCYRLGNCCPDYNASSSLSDTTNIPEGGIYRCVHGSLKHSTANNYLMVSKCLTDFTNTEVIEKCGTPSTSGVEYFLPVYSHVTGTTYRNLHCAACHYEHLDSLLSWSLELRCSSDQMKKIKYSSVLEDVMSRDGCDLYLRGVHVPDLCEDTLDTCNQTGLWAEFDQVLVDGCESYRAVYDMLYRNVFCYLCNKVSSWLGETCIDIRKHVGGSLPALSVLFDFKLSDSSVNVDDSEGMCPNKTIYDPHLEVCIPIRCETNFIYEEGQCQPYYDKQCIFTFLQFRSRIEIVTKEVHSIRKAMMSSLDEQLELSQTGQWGVFILHNSDNMATFELQIKFIYDAGIVDRLTELLNEPFVLRYGMAFGLEHLITFDVSIKADQTLGDLSEGTLNGVRSEGLNAGFRNPFISKSLCKATESSTFTEFTRCPWVTVSLADFNVLIRDDRVEFIDTGFVLENHLFRFGTPRNDIKTADIKLCVRDFLLYLTMATKTSEVANPALGWLTSITSLLSIGSCCCTVFTYCLFPTLRTQPGINNMLLAITIGLGHSIYIVGILKGTSSLVCTTFGIALHFLWLSTMLWYAVCSFHMFKVFTSTTPMSHTSLLKTTVRYILTVTIMAVSFVAINVGTSLAVSRGTDIGYGDPDSGLCWISRPLFVALTTTLPALLTVVCSIVLFTVAVCRIKQMDRPNIRTNSNNRRTFLIYIKLSVLTGITWLTITPYIYTRKEIFNYVFIGLHGCNGLFLMVAFILNKRVLLLYKSLVVRTKTSKEATNQTTFSGSSRPTSESSFDSVL